jgi:hypothetical protein
LPRATFRSPRLRRCPSRSLSPRPSCRSYGVPSWRQRWSQERWIHGDGYFVRRFPDLFRAEVTASWDVNRILQYISTFGGCLILAIWLCRWFRRATPNPVASTDLVPSWVRYVVLAGALTLGVAGAAVQLGGADSLAGKAAARLMLTGLVLGGLAAFGWYVVLWHLVRLRRRVVTS